MSQLPSTDSGSMFSTISAAVVAAIMLLVWLTSPKYTAEEPPPIPHSIPILGNAFAYAADQRRVTERASARNNRKPWSMLIAGRKHYVFESLDDIATIHRNSKTLSISAFVRMLHQSVFGMNAAEAQAMVDANTLIHDINTKILLRPENNAVTASKYLAELSKQFDAFEREVEASETRSVVRNGFPLMAKMQGEPTVRAYFGQALLDLNPDFMADLTTFVGGLWKFLIHVPRWLYPKIYRARDRLISNMQRLLEEIREDPRVTSPFWATRSAEMRGSGITEDTIAKDMLGVAFGVNANSIPTAHIALLHVIQQPDLIVDIRQELERVEYGSTTPADRISLFPRALPLLRSVFWETLRMHNTSATIREVLEPTTLASVHGSYALQKNGVVNIPAGLLHRNPAYHPSPQEFRPARFMDKSLGGDGEDSSRTLKPFGGGVSYCPGRVFAEKQVMATLAEFCWRFDMTLENADGFVVPDTANFDDVLVSPRALLRISKRREL